MRSYDIQIEFPPLADPAAPGAPTGPVRILHAVYLEGDDPQWAAKQHVSRMMGTAGLRITAQPADGDFQSQI
jgi:hypothetical protein